MSVEPASWRSLPLTSSIRSAPPLLLKTQFTASSYAVYITDLTRIWSESLSKSDILSRAEHEDTPIDPSEDADQLKILLEKLKNGLQSPPSAKNVVEITSIAQNDGQCRLQLTTRQQLPSPLPELKWTFLLNQGSGIDFSNAFVAPLLSVASLHSDQIESLITTIAEKDRLIEKLVGHLEDNKFDVKAVIGGGRAKRKGLEKFDEKIWREDIEDLEENRPLKDLVRDIFENRKLVEFGSVKKLPESSGEWWKAVEDEEVDIPVATKNKPKKIPSPSPPSKEEKPIHSRHSVKDTQTKAPGPYATASETEGDDEDFEVQKTPPPRVAPKESSSKPQSPTPAHRQPSSIPAASVASPSKPRPKIGKIGGKKHKSPSPPLPPVESPAASKHADKTSSETEDEDDDLDAVRPLPSPKKVKTVIGGREKPTPPPPEPTANEEASKPVRKTIGTIGGKKKALAVKSEPAASEEPMEVDELRTFDPSPSEVRDTKSIPPMASDPLLKIESPEPEPEDEDEKADRKRRQLEAELEAKRKAPVKKKRKF